MAYTFLEAMNASLKEAAVIKGADEELTTFVDAPRQHAIDLMIDSWNDAIRELYRPDVFSGETAEGTITLLTGVNEYAFETDFEVMVGNPIDRTNVTELTPYPGGYLQLVEDRKNPDSYEGLPNTWCENPSTRKLRVESFPTADENGKVYTYVYEKRLNMALITDTFPFTDTVVDALQGAVVQIFDRKNRKQFDAGVFQVAISQAAYTLRRSKARRTYGRTYASAS